MADLYSVTRSEKWVEKATPLVDGLVKLVRFRDVSTAAHLDAVGALARRLAAELGYSRETLDRCELAARLHDVGKNGVSLEIIQKPSALTEDEWLEMREHPAHGAAMVSCFPELAPLAEIVRLHHERMDGRGYPSRLIGSDIPVESRIIAVADAFHAMTVRRPYVAARTPAAALQELIACAGTQFDSDHVHAFVSMLGARNVTIDRSGEFVNPGSLENRSTA